MVTLFNHAVVADQEYYVNEAGFDLAGDTFFSRAQDSYSNETNNMPFQDMTIPANCAGASKPSNQYTVDSTTPIIVALKKNRKQKKGWRLNQLGVKKGSENYDLYLANDYSQNMCCNWPYRRD